MKTRKREPIPVKYLVPEYSGDKEGDLIDAFLMFFEDRDGPALVYLPKKKGDGCSCGCLVICHRNRRYKDEVWSEIPASSHRPWLNVENKDDKDIKKFLGIK